MIKKQPSRDKCNFTLNTVDHHSGSYFKFIDVFRVTSMR